MRVPVSWLKDYVAFGGTVQDLADRLTFAGIEVEGIEQIGSAHEGLVAACVRAVEPHPDADRLKICRVFDGETEHLVVCGAPEVRVDARYVFAPVGVTLHNGMTLRKAKLRGVESFGMLLAEDELGLSNDHTGLYELPKDTEPGVPLSRVLGPPETVLDLEITPNRPDCLSLIGVAREVAALSGSALTPPSFDYPEIGPAASASITVRIEDTADCPRYTARMVRGIRIGPSPVWLQRRLEAAGIRPINNIVDVTNFVMLETGQPLHAFDLARLRGGRIETRRAHKDERLITLDNVERTLDPDALVIADAEGAVALAGVMGGAESEIGPETRDVLIESACFNPARIRRTSRALDLVSEASYRFARGTDVEGANAASRRAVALILNLAGGEADTGVVDAYPHPYAPRTVSMRWDRLRRILGHDVSAEEVERVFRALELPPEISDEGCRVRVPSFRGDLVREVDLIEEVARVTGLDRIPDRTPSARIVPDVRDELYETRRRLRARLSGLGLQEAMNYSLVSSSFLDRFGTKCREERIRLPNPLSQEQSVLRTSLLPQVVETLGRNRARQVEEAAIFEMGKVFWQTGPGPIEEEERVGIGLMGPVGREPMQKRAPLSESEVFRWIRGILDGLFSEVRIPVIFREAEHEAFSSGACRAILYGAEILGYFGLARRDAAAEWRIHDPVGLAEFRWNIDALSLRGKTPVQAPPVYPAAQRDLAFLVDKTVSHEHTASVIREAAPPELENLELFDMYEGKGIAAGRKSLAYALTWRAARETLTDEQVQRFEEKIVRILREQLGAELREA